jgi:photosystem II stability/assembly factor-like uncharacterized protein
MKYIRAISLLLLSVLLANTADAQRWHSMTRWNNALATSPDNGIHIVGWQGWIVQSWDGGTSWQHVQIGQHVDPTLPVHEELMEVAFSDSAHGLILGRTHLFRTTDGGRSWEALSYPGHDGYSNLCALPNGTFCFLDALGRFYSGSTVFTRTVPNDTDYVHYLQSTTDNYLIATTWNGSAIRSSDGGATWQKAPGIYSYHSVFTDHLHGVSTFNYGIVTTTDGGATWDTLFRNRSVEPIRLDSTLIRLNDVVYNVRTRDTAHIPLPQGVSRNPLSIARVAGKIFYIGEGSSAYYGVYASTDSGRTVTEEFTSQPSFFEEPLKAVNDSTLTTRDVARDTTYIYRSIDTGATWKQVAANKDLITDHLFLTDSLGLYQTQDTLYKTTNAGRSWLPTPLVVPKNDYLEYLRRSGNKVLVLGQTHAWISSDLSTFTLTYPCARPTDADTKGDTIVVTGYDSALHNVAAISYDAGVNWKTFPNTTGGSIAYAGSGVFYTIRSNKGLSISTDEGQTWKLLLAGTNNALFLDTRTAVALGNNDIFSTIDGGKTWRIDHVEAMPDGYARSGGDHAAYIPNSYIFITSSGGCMRTTLAELLKPGPDTLPVPQKLQWYLGTASSPSLGVGQAPDGSLLRSQDYVPYVSRSTDRGNTWTASSVPYAFSVRQFLVHAASTYAIDYGSIGMLRSSDNGRSWKRVIGNLAAPRSSLLFTKTGKLLAGTSVGMFRATTNDTTYDTKDTLLAHHVIYRTARDSSGILYALNFDSVYRSSDDGVHWNVVLARLPREAAFTDIATAPSGIVFVAGMEQLYRSPDGISGWTTINPPPNGSSPNTAPRLAVLDDTTLFTSGEYAFYTTDGSLHWKRCDTLWSAISDIFRTRDGYIVAATRDHNVSRTIKPFSNTRAAVPVQHAMQSSTAYTLYPNPATGSVHIDPIPIASTVRIFNNAGQFVAERTVTAEGSLDLHDLPTDDYWLVISSTDDDRSSTAVRLNLHR